MDPATPTTRRWTSTAWAASGAVHLALAIALRLVPQQRSTPPQVIDAPRVDLELAPPPVETPPPVAPPVVPPPRVIPTPTPAARVAHSEARPVTTAPATPEVEPALVAPTITPTPTQPTPVQPTAVQPPRAADILRASNTLAVTGASEGWLAPTPTVAPNRNIYGGSTNGEPPSPERLREIAAGPTMTALSGTVRDHRPAGSGEHDSFVARRAAEAFNPVREVPGLGPAVRRAPEIRIAGVQRAVPGGEMGVAQNFDQAQQVSFAGMTGGTRMPDITYRALRTELDVDQDASGAILDVHVTHASGLRAFDAAAERAMREAMPEHPWTAGRSRWTRWLFEVSEASSFPVLLSGNEGWTVLNTESDGVRVRMRVRLIAQRVTGTAARDGGG